MFRSLRTRLIASHILPVLLVIPLMGVALLFVLENRFLLPVVYRALEEDAVLLSGVIQTQPGLWGDMAGAQAFLESAGPFLGGDAALILPNGRVLASGSMEEGSLPDQITELPDFSSLQAGQIVRLQNGPSAMVFIPVPDASGRLLGIVRMHTHLTTVSEQIYQMRYLIGAVLLVGIAAGVVFAWLLALQIEHPIRESSEAIVQISEGRPPGPIALQGPEELKALIQAVNSLNTRLQQMEQARRQLLANLVHELGRPLGALRSATQALTKGASEDPELSADLLKGMDVETAHLQRLLEDLSGMTDQVLGSFELNRGTIDLPEWLPFELLPWKSAALEKHLAWESVIPPDLPPLEADPDRLSQAIGNLLSNAIKFTPAGGNIFFQASAEEGQVQLEVTDNGPGIAQEELDKIFNPFFRGGEKRIVQGMGLGLTIARDIIEAHGGNITVMSRQAGGSTFRIVLPA